MKKIIFMLLPILITFSLASCGGSNTQNTASNTDSSQINTQQFQEENPAAEGFDAQNSDPKAIKIANEVMKASGGRANWDKTRLISWNFFNRRQLYWDKKTGDVRIDYNNGKMNILLNVYREPLKGKVRKGSVAITQADSLQKYLKRGKSIWINDMYWLCMPFKLKDSGVTLKYAREDTVKGGRKADVLTLSFKNVGDTPQNKYEVYIDQQSKLVTQWAYFKEASQDSANFVMPWLDYQKYGNLMLSGNRGRAKLSNIQVVDSVPEKLFTSFDKVTLK
ncbi:hypothetical protein [uncultured Microscilla sp.]|uniref:hypothetical protein n=1 Tax=uncultured Microscilla sp. TaxID=432653 RepID=UPI00262B9620|nr:hypothetical protein [uncultured Microscilla sp.]